MTKLPTRSLKSINKITQLLKNEAYQIWGVTLIGAYLPITEYRWPAKQITAEGLSKLNNQWYSIIEVLASPLKEWPFYTLEEIEDE